MHIKVTGAEVQAIARKDGKGNFYKVEYLMITEDSGERVAVKANATLNSVSEWGLAPGEYDIDADKAAGVDRFGGAVLRINRNTVIPRK